MAMKNDTIKRQQTQALAVTGYVSAELVSELTDGAWISSGKRAEIQVQPGMDEVLMRVDASDVHEVRCGATSKGHTVVQLILKARAQVETVVKTVASLEGITRLNDPTLQRLTASATAKMILI